MKLALSLAMTGVAIAVLTTPEVRRTPTSSACYGPDWYSAFHIGLLREKLSSTSADGVDFRTETHLPMLPDTAIQLVSDSTSCAHAVATYNASLSLDGRTAAQVYLIRAGAMYVASNPNVFPGRDWTEHVVMDSAFTYMSDYLR